MADDDDTKLDIEAMNDKAEELKKLEEISFDADKFEDIEREFEQFLKEIVGLPNLKRFKEEYTKIYKTLRTSYEGERKLIQRSKAMITEIWDYAQNVKSAIRMASNEVERISDLKQRVEDESAKVSQKKDEEDVKRQTISQLNDEIGELDRRANEHHELEEDIILKQLQDEFAELSRQKDDQNEKILAQKQRNNQMFVDISGARDHISKQTKEIETLDSQILETKIKADEIAKQQDGLKAQSAQTVKKRDIEDENLKELQKQIAEIREKTADKNIEFENCEEELKKVKEQLNRMEKKRREQEKNLQTCRMNNQRLLASNKDNREQLASLHHDYDEVDRNVRKVKKERAIIAKKGIQMIGMKEENEITRDRLKLQYELDSREYEKEKGLVEELKKNIEQKIRERDLLTKDVVEKEEEERTQRHIEQTYWNQQKKLSGKLLGFKVESKKLHQTMWNLDNEKEKYARDASLANSKYYMCLEQVKLKNNLITKLQKKNIEAEARLKSSQNLYEAVRSDRNLYAKNLVEAQDEIAELKMKYKIMVQQINQLKEEIGMKDTAKQQEDAKFSNFVKENQKHTKSISQITAQIESSEDMIKTQENDIARLKYVISEAEAEKQKQKKDYEMVICERDILGTQLIKRDEELALLYEKIKIQKSTLKKGEIYYQSKRNDIQKLVQSIKDHKRELIDSQKETACIPDLKREIYLLQKELIEQQQKVKFLTDELMKPLNVHRWRKLESTDIETYELIQKIQSLQKRLIAKTEEVSEKDVLIQEKEKLYIELKNILAKQSGPEVTEKLVIYQQNLKERCKQLKEMTAELKNYQSQVHAYKFEIERIDNQTTQTKDHYFYLKNQQKLGMVPEMDEEQYQEGQHDPNQGQDMDKQMQMAMQQQQQQLHQQQQMAQQQQQMQEQDMAAPPEAQAQDMAPEQQVPDDQLM